MYRKFAGMMMIGALAGAMVTPTGACAMTEPAATSAESGGKGKPVAAFFMRGSVIPRAGDEVHLQKGLSLMLGSTSGEFTIVKYEMKDGEIVWKASSGSVDKRTARKIDKAVAMLMKRMK